MTCNCLGKIIAMYLQKVHVFYSMEKLRLSLRSITGRSQFLEISQWIRITYISYISYCYSKSFTETIVNFLLVISILINFVTVLIDWSECLQIYCKVYITAFINEYFQVYLINLWKNLSTVRVKSKLKHDEDYLHVRMNSFTTPKVMFPLTIHRHLTSLNKIYHLRSRGQ